MYRILNYMKSTYHIFLQELLKLQCQLFEWGPVERKMTPASAHHIKPVTPRQPFHWIRQQSTKLVPFTVSLRGTWAHYCNSLDKTSATCVIIENTAFKENYILCIVRQKHILRPIILTTRQPIVKMHKLQKQDKGPVLFARLAHCDWKAFKMWRKRTKSLGRR